MRDKRRFERLGKNLPVRHRTDGSGEIHGSEAMDISTGGLRLKTKEQMSPGRTVNLEVSFAEVEGPYFAIGEVVWSSPAPGGGFETGIRFLRIVTRDQLSEF